MVNVIFHPVQIPFGAYDVVPIKGLPIKNNIIYAGVFGYRAFKPGDDGG
jgi:hypothetical protein